LGNRTDNQIKNRYYGRLKILYKNKVIKERRKNLEKTKKIQQAVGETRLVSEGEKMGMSEREENKN